MSKAVNIKRNKDAAPAMADVWHNFRREIDQLFDRFTSGFEGASAEPFNAMQRYLVQDIAGFARPAVDVSEGEKAYTITAELPGVDEKNIEVSIDGDMLVIKGEKHREKEEKSKDCYLSERSYGSFQRMFALPRGIDAGKIYAGFHNGVLTVVVPKTPGNQNVQKVEVTAA